MRCLQKIDIFNVKLQAYIDTLDVKKRNKYTIKNDLATRKLEYTILLLISHLFVASLNKKMTFEKKNFGR